MVTWRGSGANQKPMELVPSADFWTQKRTSSRQKESNRDNSWRCRWWLCELGLSVPGAMRGWLFARKLVATHTAMRQCLLPNEGKEELTQVEDSDLSKIYWFRSALRRRKLSSALVTRPKRLFYLGARLVGGHAKPGQRVPLEYSRDALAEPMRRLKPFIKQVRYGVVRYGVFKPEGSRGTCWRA